MWVGGNHKPYRLPCEGSQDCFVGVRFSHAKASDVGIARFIYDSEVPNWGTPPPDTIPPYERFNPDTGGTCEEQGTCGSGSAPCKQWIGTDSDQYNVGSPPPIHFTQPTMLQSVVIANGGTGYTVGDNFPLVGGTLSPYGSSGYGVAAAVQVTRVDPTTGATLSVSIISRGSYSSNPTTPNSPTGGSGTGISLALTFTPATVSFSVCRKRGFKTAQAKRYWHGRFGFLSNDLTSPFDRTIAADQTKYLTLNGTSSVSEFGGTGVGCSGETHAKTFTIETSVDANSGVTTTTGSDDFVPCPFDPDNPLYGVPYPDLSMCNELVSDWIAHFSTVSVEFSDPTVYSVATTSSSWTATLISDGTVRGSSAWSDSGGKLTKYNDVNNDCADDGGGQTFTAAYVETLAITDTTFDWSLVETSDGFETLTQTVSVTLSDENTASDVLADATELLSNWPLDDDHLYPWRTDSLQQIAPMVSRNEVQGNVEPSPGAEFEVPDPNNTTPVDDSFCLPPTDPDWTPTYAPIPYVDPFSFICDGTVLGAPNPAGYENQWDARYVDVRFCCDTDPDDSNPATAYIYGWGGIGAASNSMATARNYNAAYGTQLPLTCTQWTPRGNAVHFMPQAFMLYGDQRTFTDPNCGGDIVGDKALFIQKYAVIKEQFPSYNFAHPAGDDVYAGKFNYDETLVYSATNISGSGAGSTWTLTAFDGTTPTIADTSGYWGGAVVGGYFAITSYVAGVVTLGAQKFSLPSNFSSRSGDAAVCFGKIRFPSAPGIIGRASVSAITDDGTLRHLTTTALPSLGMDLTAVEKVKICDSLMTVLADNVTITRVSDTEFTVTTALATIALAKWITPELMEDGSTSGDHYWWNDSFPKQQFVNLEWLFDYRDVSLSNSISAFTATQQCLPFLQCDPQVVCYSPNGETFANGITIDMPDSGFVMDEVYGSQWQGEVIFAMPDPLWQVPHHPVGGHDDLTDEDFTGSEINWIEDDSSCHTDGVDPDSGLLNKYYPHRPLVEPLLALPTNGGPSSDETAPALPSGVSLGFIDPTVDSVNGIYPLAMLGVSFGGDTLLGATDERIFLMTVESTACGDCQQGGQYQSDYNIACA
jgi:hypothetical protein